MDFTGMLKEGSLQDKVILITGGGTGLGKSMGQYFMELGANLIITSRKQDVLNKTAKEFSNYSGDILPLSGDGVQFVYYPEYYRTHPSEATKKPD